MRINPCIGCASCTSELGWRVDDCPSLDTDVCIEFRLRGVVREQWIYEQAVAEPSKCKRCGSIHRGSTRHLELDIVMEHCESCGLVFGPQTATPIQVARANAAIFRGAARRIAREHLAKSHTAYELAESIGYDFVPQVFTDRGQEIMARVEAALAKGIPLAVVLAQVLGEVF